MNHIKLTVSIVVVLIGCCIIVPCYDQVDGDAASSPVDESPDLSYERAVLSEMGYDTDSMSDPEIELLWGWFANKNLIGEYDWDDPAGVNWLLEQAEVNAAIESVNLIGGSVSFTLSIGSVVLSGLKIVDAILQLSLYIVNFYEDIMNENALEKAELAMELMSQQKDYAVYETTVFWNLVPNGYEVEEC